MERQKNQKGLKKAKAEAEAKEKND